MVAAYAKGENGQEALSFFFGMQQKVMQPNQVAFASVLTACPNTAALGEGKEIHKEVIWSRSLLDVFVENVLVDMYVKSRSIENARECV